MPQTVTILVGLPGSGKTTFLKQRAEKAFDEFHGGAFRDSPAFTASRCYQELKDELHSGRDCIISDIAYCASDRLRAAENGLNLLAHELGIELEIRHLYFANDADACRHNVIHRFSREPGRDYLGELRNIDAFSKSYDPPSSCIPVQTCCLEIR
jgi:hypothetical protein